MWKQINRAGLVPALLLSALPLPGRSEPSLALPIDCIPGATCYIQNYMDRDPGPGARDYTCAGLSYDGHKGTDFALPSLTAMIDGVEVRAAAAGTVRGVRDGMIDRFYTPAEDERIDGRDCGNGVVLDHGDGWESQYCHMRQGSLRVSSGQKVEAGTPLGLVGLSGRSQFPHLHISLRHKGQPVDPFTPRADAATCGTGNGATLWADVLPYQPGAVLSAGFATEVPEYDAVKAGTAAALEIPRDTPALILWGFAFGGQTGDRMTLIVDGPEGRVFDADPVLEKDQAMFFRAGGKRMRAPLTAGLYAGTVLLTRDGREISRKTVEIDIR